MAIVQFIDTCDASLKYHPDILGRTALNLADTARGGAARTMQWLFRRMPGQLESLALTSHDKSFVVGGPPRGTILRRTSIACTTHALLRTSSMHDKVPSDKVPSRTPSIGW